MSNFSGYIQSRFGDPENRRRIYVGAFIALIIAGFYLGMQEAFPEQTDTTGFGPSCRRWWPLYWLSGRVKW